MMFACSSLTLFLTLSLASAVAVSAVTDHAPCPLPGLDDVVDTPEKCACFYAFVESKLNLEDASTFDEAMNEDIVYHFAQTGKYFGPDGVQEMWSWINGGEFTIGYGPVGDAMILDVTASTAEQCVITVADKRRVQMNPKYTENNEEVCIETFFGMNLYYSLTGNEEKPILISTMDTWCPDEFMQASHNRFSSTRATAEYVCDVMLNVCEKEGKGKKSQKSRKKLKMKASKKKTEKCIETYNKLPLWDEVGGRASFDGNTKGCRVMHSYWATNRAYHCPHVTFSTTDKDENGFNRCVESERTLDTDYFSQETLELFKYASNSFGLGDDGVDIKVGGGCPSN